MTVNDMWNDPNLSNLRGDLYKNLEVDVPQNPDDVTGPEYFQPSTAVGSDDPKAPKTPVYDPTTTMTAYETALLAMQERDNARQSQNTLTTMKGTLSQLGLNSLYDTVVNFIKDGYDAESIMTLIRTTPEYAQRFPAMSSLTAKGRAISEGEYIAYEQQASSLERRYGLPQGMLMGSVTKLLQNEVSATELNDRVVLASSASIQAPQEVKDMFTQYYGIDSGGMTGYFLDPDVATPLLEKQYASSVIGSEAARQGIGIDIFGAENLQSLGITQAEARQGFGQVASATGLTQGAGDTVNQQQLIAGTMGQNEKARQDIERAVGGRLGRFQGGGEFLNQGGQNVGLGTAATR